jgi:GAF domain-containing protein
MTETADYQIAPIPDNEAERLAALRAAMCAYVPREERFDRITRMAQRMLHVPMAMISIVEDDVRWFRSVQGVVKIEVARELSFCAHAIVSGGIFQICDTLLDNRFNGLPSVIGPPFIRSYCGYPLELAPGLRVGSLCVMDTLPRTFAADDLEIMTDLAHMAQTELRNSALAENQKALLSESDRVQRKLLLDPATGCWSERGFEELIRRTLRDVVTGTAQAALCGIQIHNVNDFKVGEGPGADEARAMVITQFIRQRLPQNAVLCRLPGGRACILFAARDKGVLGEQIASFLQAPDSKPIAGITFTQALNITSAGLRLKPEHAADDAGRLVETVMGRRTDDGTMSSIIRYDTPA